MLNSNKRSYRQTFAEEIERQLETYQLERDLQRIERSCVNEELKKK